MSAEESEQAQRKTLTRAERVLRARAHRPKSMSFRQRAHSMNASAASTRSMNRGSSGLPAMGGALTPLRLFVYLHESSLAMNYPPSTPYSVRCDDGKALETWDASTAAEYRDVWNCTVYRAPPNWRDYVREVDGMPPVWPITMGLPPPVIAFPARLADCTNPFRPTPLRMCRQATLQSWLRHVLLY
jgi:hypothetical protein